MYKIVRMYSPIHSQEQREKDFQKFEEKIQGFIDEGWIPHGGFSISDNFLTQAMVKEDYLYRY